MLWLDQGADSLAEATAIMVMAIRGVNFIFAVYISRIGVKKAKWVELTERVCTVRRLKPLLIYLVGRNRKERKGTEGKKTK